jgi:hypothetical protein
MYPLDQYIPNLEFISLEEKLKYLILFFTLYNQ